MKYEQLHTLLRTWSSEEGAYDFNGVVHLLLACLDNLRAFAMESELEDIGESFDEAQIEFLVKIAQHVGR